MFKHKSLLTLFILLFVLLSLQCKRPDCSKDVPLETMIPQEVLDYVDFKAGSYWVYQDSVTGEIDSEVVISSKHLMENVSTTNNCGEVAISYRFENINMLINRYDSAGTLKGSFIREFNNSAKKSNANQINVFIIDNNNSFLIGYPFSLKYFEGEYECTETLLDTLKLDNKEYIKALKLSKIFATAPSNYILFYFANQIGVIKKTSVIFGKTDRVFKLIRYKIF